MFFHAGQKVIFIHMRIICHMFSLPSRSFWRTVEGESFSILLTSQQSYYSLIKDRLTECRIDTCSVNRLFHWILSFIQGCQSKRS